MRLDNVFNGTQHGIDLSNTTSALNSYSQFQVTGNVVSGTQVGSLEAVFFASSNAGLFSPLIKCNAASQSYQGFVFSGNNTPGSSIPGTQWLANTMQNLGRGMVLTTNGEIGMQGHPLLGSGNQWLGSTWGGTVYHVWTQGSFAQNSPIFYAAGATALYPSNNDGTPTNFNFVNFPPQIVPSGANASCSDPSARSGTFEVTNEDYSEDAIAIKDFALYRFLWLNDSVLGADPVLNSYFTGMSGSNIELLSQAEAYLYGGNYASARSALTGFSGNNTIEDNYQEFYRLYGNYLEDRDHYDLFSQADSSDLRNFADLCPEQQGACVFQARALFECIYSVIPSYPGCNDGTGARPALPATEKKQYAFSEIFSVAPNPASDRLSVIGPENARVVLMLYDNLGRQVVHTTLKIQSSCCDIPIDLPNGIYLVKISDEAGNATRTKLIIAK